MLAVGDQVPADGASGVVDGVLLESELGGDRALVVALHQEPDEGDFGLGGGGPEVVAGGEPGLFEGGGEVGVGPFELILWRRGGEAKGYVQVGEAGRGRVRLTPVGG